MLGVDGRRDWYIGMLLLLLLMMAILLFMHSQGLPKLLLHCNTLCPSFRCPRAAHHQVGAVLQNPLTASSLPALHVLGAQLLQLQHHSVQVVAKAQGTHVLT